jgi:hypothetical protein
LESIDYEDMNVIENATSGSPSGQAVTSVNKWMEQVGVTACTAWRWRKRGWLTTVNIAGRQYVTQEAIDEFNRRAVAGDFSQVPVVPKRN